jgi:DNA-binding transcriptional LysR family regulator
VSCAAPSYLERFGTPENVGALIGHQMVGFHSSARRALLPLEFSVDGDLRNVHLPSVVTVNGAESLITAAKLGFGLIQVPRYHVEDDLQEGTPVAVLNHCPPSPTPVPCSTRQTASCHRGCAYSSIGLSGCSTRVDLPAHHNPLHRIAAVARARA